MLIMLLSYLLQDPTSIDLFIVNMEIIYVIKGSTALPASLTDLIVFFRTVKMKKKNSIIKIDQLVPLNIYRFSSCSDYWLYLKWYSLPPCIDIIKMHCPQTLIVK